MKPRVFISHSGSEGATGVLLDALVAALKAADFTPLIDLDHITPASEFHSVVDRMILTCDAAIVVMNRRAHALESTWVFSEASRLRDRVAANHDFQVVVLCTEGLTDKDLMNADWAPTRLADRALVPVRDAAADTARDAAGQLAATRALIEAGGAERHLRDLLALLGLPPDALRALGDDLADTPIAGDPGVAVARRLVTATNHARVARFCGKLARRDLKLALEILRLAFPFSWIRVEAAGQVAEALVDRAPLAINTMTYETAKAYADRGCPALPLWKVHDLSAATSGDVEELVDEAARRLRADDGDLDLDLFAELDESARDPLEGIVMLAVPCENGDRDVAQRFREFADERNHVGVILKLGTETTETAIGALPADVRYLRPALDAGRELQGLKAFASAIGHVTAQAD